MREFFSQFGKVVDATVMLDRETGRSKGFGFVSFENVNVEPLLGFGNLEIDGKLVRTYRHHNECAHSPQHRLTSSSLNLVLSERVRSIKRAEDLPAADATSTTISKARVVAPLGSLAQEQQREQALAPLVRVPETQASIRKPLPTSTLA